jgi:hypothetical protein
LFAQKQINNCKKISDFYEKVIGANQIDIGNGIGNVTILQDDTYYPGPSLLKRSGSMPMELQGRNFKKFDNSHQTYKPHMDIHFTEARKELKRSQS